MSERIQVGGKEFQRNLDAKGILSTRKHWNLESVLPHSTHTFTVSKLGHPNNSAKLKCKCEINMNCNKEQKWLISPNDSMLSLWSYGRFPFAMLKINIIFSRSESPFLNGFLSWNYHSFFQNIAQTSLTVHKWKVHYVSPFDPIVPLQFQTNHPSIVGLPNM